MAIPSESGWGWGKENTYNLNGDTHHLVDDTNTSKCSETLGKTKTLVEVVGMKSPAVRLIFSGQEGVDDSERSGACIRVVGALSEESRELWS